jgi:quinol monooxygenase YgiN
MAKTKITVVANIKAKLGKEKEVRSILMGLLAPTRSESGCINYDLHQSMEDPCSFVFYENWTSQSALDEHLQSSHIAKAMSEATPILAEPVEISLWNPIHS